MRGLIGGLILAVSLVCAGSALAFSWQRCAEGKELPECVPRVDLTRVAEHCWWTHHLTDDALEQISEVCGSDSAAECAAACGAACNSNASCDLDLEAVKNACGAAAHAACGASAESACASSCSSACADACDGSECPAQVECTNIEEIAEICSASCAAKCQPLLVDPTVADAVAALQKACENEGKRFLIKRRSNGDFATKCRNFGAGNRHGKNFANPCVSPSETAAE
jgi:hypothetical protein